MILTILIAVASCFYYLCVRAKIKASTKESCTHKEEGARAACRRLIDRGLPASGTATLVFYVCAWSPFFYL